LEPPQPDPDGAEARLIELLLSRRGAPPPWIRVDAGHDCAVTADGWALEVDTMVEGVHFDGRLSAADVGWKAVAAAVSDLGACGAEPVWLLLSLSVPDAPDRETWVAGLADGVGEACAELGVYLVGGDTTGVRPGGPRVISVSAGGRVVAAPVTRAGARAGDLLWVTGTLGLAGAGWMLDDPPPMALAALRRPRPPVPFALELARQGLATAAMDLSDGLRADLPRLCRASGVGAEIDPHALPADPWVAARADRLRLQVAGGEDYELLFASRADDEVRVRAAAAARGARVTPIGRVTDGRAVELRGASWPSAAFAHFGASA
jgi:thiamine-monophosphate kinase